MTLDFTSKVFETWFENNFNNKVISNYNYVIEELVIICNNGRSSNFLLEQLCFLKSSVAYFKNDKLFEALKMHFYNALICYEINLISKKKYFKCNCEICNYYKNFTTY